MKRILFLGICAIFSFASYGMMVSATTASFIDKDGRVFCETDALDGSYRICTKDQIASKDLINWEKYNSRLVETSAGRFCVEDWKEVDIWLCQWDLPILPIPVVATWNTQTGTTATGITGSWMPISIVPEKPIASPIIPDPIAPNPVATGIVIIESGFITGIKNIYVTCFTNSWDMNCSKAIWKLKDTFMEWGTFFKSSSIVLFLVCSIFWFNMISHAFSNPVSLKILWILILLIFSFPGAVLYYFAGYRPYIAMVIASSPPRPPSFFY